MVGVAVVFAASMVAVVASLRKQLLGDMVGRRPPARRRQLVEPLEGVLFVHHQAILPVTEGKLDLGPWQQVFYAEFDGRRPKRLLIKVIGE